MLRRSKLWLLLFVGMFSVGLVSPAVSQQQERLMIQWRFDKDGDFRGWTLGGHVGDASVAGGMLRGRAIGGDPILTGPVFEIEATPTQRVEINMRTSEPGQAELFWTNTLQGKYGGFSQQRNSSFPTHDDGQFHVYQIRPFWHAAGKVIRLRLDPPNTGEFQIQWIRIVDDADVTRSRARRWKFDTDLQGWRGCQEVGDPVVRDGCLLATARGEQPILISPLLRVPAEENPFVCIRMATDAGSMGRVFCVSSTQFGWEATTFPLQADGHMHWYNIDVGSLRKWQDEIVMLALQPTDVQGATANVESIEIADGPRGPAELEFAYLGAAEGVNRAGRPAKVTCAIRNRGGELAEGVVATLSVPDGVRIIGQPQQKIDKITHYLAKDADWLIEFPTPGKVDVSVKLEGPGLEPTGSTAAVRFTRVPPVPEGSYVPEPKPVASKYDVGVFYFPGWDSMSRWRPIFDYPARRPVLGWYDEANPECADWQIKWAVEHGVTFFMVDWYWCQGNRHLEHWLHDAYMKAKHRKYLKWAIMWANHNGPGTHSLDDWRKVTQYWIDNYFGMEEYYRIDGRPAVFIWAPGNVRRDLGGSRQAAGLYAASQQMARDAGYPGIYFAAMSSHQSERECQELKSEGYEGFTSYHSFELAMQRAGTRHFPFADVVRTSPEVWQRADRRAAGLLYMPIVDTGWSSEPWHGTTAMAIGGRTPEQFGQLCRLAKAYADKRDKKIITVGPCNEWGEGSYIEPCTEFGFACLDQLRDAFCEPGDYPPNLIPADVGLGPYDLPRLAQKTAWEFDTDGDREGWTPNGHLRMVVKDGCLAGESTGTDPVLQAPGIQVEAASAGCLSIRMKSSAADRAQLFWQTPNSGMSEAISVRFDVAGDGKFHDYKLELGKCWRWRGLIVSLRLDPANRPGVKFAIDSIRLE